VKAQTRLARIVGADSFVGMHTSARRERPTHAAVRSWRNAVGRADLLLSSGGQSKQTEGTNQQSQERSSYPFNPNRSA
jgi:hypothetical protein